MILMAVYISGLATGFLLARCFQNSHLNNKERQLLAYRDHLVDIANDLQFKDSEIRKKWQAMVSDFSAYQAMAGGFKPGQWTEMDDVYLHSWASAEKTP